MSLIKEQQEKILVSVIIPVYNVELYLEECLNSVISQSYSNIEIILVDDGSTDRSASICEHYSKIDDRIVVIHKKNGGLSSARNAGLDVAKGNYILFVDSDDFIAKVMIMDMILATVEYGYQMVVSPITSEKEKLTSGGTTSRCEKTPEAILYSFLAEKEITTSASGKLYSSALWENIRFPEGLIFEDFATIYKTVIKCEKICVINSSYYYYRPNPTGITGAAFSEKKMDYYTVTHRLQQDLIMLGYDTLMSSLDNRTVRYSISFFRDISRSHYQNEEIIDYIVKVIRNKIFKYMMSDYKLSSKLYGLLITISPRTAICVFRRKK